MQTSDYTCGPAALATVLQNMGFNVTEHELKVLAGTDETGTSMYGLAQAARSKGLSAAGMRLSIGELRPNMIVHVIKDGTPHYSVVKEVTNESVRLADPSLGNIELTREKFNEIYTGNALVITDPNMEAPDANSSIETSANNITDTVSVQLENLTAVEMESIKGQQLSASANMQLTAEEMQSIRGRVIWKVTAAAAGIGAAAGVAKYAITTPRNRWTWGGAGRAALGGAVAVVITIHGGRFINKRWPAR